MENKEITDKMKTIKIQFTLKLMSHHSLWSEAARSADSMAHHTCVAVSLTYCFYINLRHLQNQTQLLAEQQLHDCVDDRGSKNTVWFCAVKLHSLWPVCVNYK